MFPVIRPTPPQRGDQVSMVSIHTNRLTGLWQCIPRTPNSLPLRASAVRREIEVIPDENELYTYSKASMERETVQDCYWSWNNM